MLVPHHAGRKRLHLEIKEKLTRMGNEWRDRALTSYRAVVKSLSDFARSHRSQEEEEQALSEEMKAMIAASSGAEEDNYSTMTDEEILVGSLNGGRRVDYVLQEAPFESFNDYLFALSSHACYWESEDTALLMLREIYAAQQILPVMPGDKIPLKLHPAPPLGSYVPPVDNEVEQSFAPPSCAPQSFVPPPLLQSDNSAMPMSLQVPTAESNYQPNVSDLNVPAASAAPPPPRLNAALLRSQQQSKQQSIFVKGGGSVFAQQRGGLFRK